MKVVNVHGKRDRYIKVMEEYFDIVPPEMFRKWQDFLFNESISLAQKEIQYGLIKDRISKLKILFKERVIQLNKRVKKEGFLNYIEAYLSWNQIPREKYEWFLKNIDNFISLVMSEEVPVQVLMKREKDWNMFNIPYPLGNQIPSDKFEIPNQVYSLIVAYDQMALKYKDRLDIKYDNEEFYSTAIFNKEKNIVEILLKPGKDDIYDVLSFVHHLGYAFNTLETADKGEDPHKIPKYLSKYKTLEYGMKFLKAYVTVNHQKVLRYNLLSEIAATLFEIEIFTNPKQDFDEAYARAINRCYPMTHQTENPFYVYYKRFLLRPMGELMESMIEMELYLKDSSE